MSQATGLGKNRVKTRIDGTGKMRGADRWLGTVGAKKWMGAAEMG